jgi:hypothetical protein
MTAVLKMLERYGRQHNLCSTALALHRLHVPAGSRHDHALQTSMYPRVLS